MPLGVFVAGLAAAPIGWMMRNSIPRLGWGLLIAGPIGAIFFAPSLLRDRVTVSADGFHLQSGIWGMSSVHDVNFADLQDIRITAETRRGRRGRKSTSYYMNCDKKSGGSAKVPMNNSVAEASVVAVLEAAKARGIPIHDETGGQ